MDGKKPFQYHKSPSRASRVVCETLNSDKLVLFASVSSPLRSPSREKLQVARKKVRQGSIFALPRRSKVSMEAEEPDSPKVSCIGQVRTSKKHILGDGKAGRYQHFKPTSTSPARFLRSLSRKSKWVSLFCMQKVLHCATSSSRGHCAGKVNSCFGFGSNWASGYEEAGTSCSAFLANSLLFLQGRAGCSKNGVAQMCSAAQHVDMAKNNTVSTVVPTSRERLMCEQGARHVFSHTQADNSSEPKIVQQEESHACQTMVNKHVHEMKLVAPTNLSGSCGVEMWLGRNTEDSKHRFSLPAFDESRQAQAEEDLTSSLYAKECSSHCEEGLASLTSNAPTLEDNISIKGRMLTSNAPMLEDNMSSITHTCRELEATHVIDDVPSSSNGYGESHRSPLPQLCEMDLLCFLGNRTPFVWMASSGDTFTLLESSLYKRFALLESKAKLTRSCSAMSYRTMIQLLRCKSAPGRVY